MYEKKKIIDWANAQVGYVWSPEDYPAGWQLVEGE